jgi:aspartyl-tRNA(Asn)/glutamyl-tRNA(Gln) amidotransferase subunit A
MKTPVLKGRALAIARKATSQPAIARAAHIQAGTTHGLRRIHQQPWSDRQHLDEWPIPITGAPPRQFGADTPLGAPADVGNGRTTTAQLHQAFLAGDVTPVDIIGRLSAIHDQKLFGPATHDPCITLRWEQAFIEAERSTERYRRKSPLSPVDGMPTVIKDHHAIAGLPCWAGTSWNRDPATADSWIVRALRDNGAIVYGKTHATEWGMQPTGYNPHWLMPHNVYNANRAAGGSSTGTGVAVSLGLVPFGAGSDGGGSIRIPATLNGVFGIKPTFQRVGRTGDFWRYSSVAHNGPLACCTADLVESLIATGATPDPDDDIAGLAPHSPDLASTWRAALGRGIRGARIGVYRHAFAECEPAIAQSCMTALRALERDGAVLIDIDIPLADLSAAMGVMVIGTETMGMLTDVEEHQGEATGDDIRLLLNVLGQVSARDYFIAQRTRAQLRRNLAHALSSLDLIAMPAVACVAPPFDLKDDRVAIYDDQAINDLTRMAFLANLTGIPAGSVPTGMVGGLPCGLQFMGDAWDEASVFAAMAHCERTGVTSIPRPPLLHRLLDV